MMLLWILRFFVFNLYESPKYLMGRGRDEAAVGIVHKVAAYNGKTSTLTVEQLKGAGKLASEVEEAEMDVSAIAAIKRKLAIFDASHVKPLFATRKLAYSTSLLIILWGKLLLFSLQSWPGWLRPDRQCSAHWACFPTVSESSSITCFVLSFVLGTMAL